MHPIPLLPLRWSRRVRLWLSVRAADEAAGDEFQRQIGRVRWTDTVARKSLAEHAHRYTMRRIRMWDEITAVLRRAA